MNFLFWNIKGKSSFFDLICELVRDNSIGVLMLAEFPEAKQQELVKMLCSCVGRFRYLKPIKSKVKVEVFTSLPSTCLRIIEDASRFSVVQYHSNDLNKDFNIFMCHLISKINNSEYNQSHGARELADAINRVEDHLNNDLSIVCGDLNMNPFEEGLVGSDCLNAVMSKVEASKGTRRVSGKDYKMFYNPMWSFMGDNGRGIVPGTMYHNPYQHMQYYWNIYDQVLIRPSVIPYFVDRYLDILTCSKSKGLLTVNHTLKEIYSDHLPIKFSIKNK